MPKIPDFDELSNDFIVERVMKFFTAEEMEQLIEDLNQALGDKIDEEDT